MTEVLGMPDPSIDIAWFWLIVSFMFNVGLVIALVAAFFTIQGWKDMWASAFEETERWRGYYFDLHEAAAENQRELDALRAASSIVDTSIEAEQDRIADEVIDEILREAEERAEPTSDLRSG